MSSEKVSTSKSSLITHHSLLPCRLIIDLPQGGAWNMAVDEALLGSAVDNGVATLRFYRWSEPTLSLGYFQKLADRELHTASRGCPVVRRHSGGGAIVHDQEVTYSLALPPKSPLLQQSEQVYRRAHEALLAALADESPAVSSRLAANLCSTAIRPAAGPEPFLCFQRRARCDVLLAPGAEEAATIDGKHKICGSAQRKRRGALLQHGSCLLSRSPAAPELAGLRELGGVSGPPESLAREWAEEIGRQLALELEAGRLTAAEQRFASEIENKQFAAAGWTGRR